MQCIILYLAEQCITILKVVFSSAVRYHSNEICFSSSCSFCKGNNDSAHNLISNLFSHFKKLCVKTILTYYQFKVVQRMCTYLLLPIDQATLIWCHFCWCHFCWCHFCWCHFCWRPFVLPVYIKCIWPIHLCAGGSISLYINMSSC